MKTICVTDSGLGGLSVCAELVKALKQAGKGADIVYFNACYADDLGYNAIARRSEKIAMFDQALAGMERYCHPDEILVACNTLSVLLEETAFADRRPEIARSIVDAAVALVRERVTLEERITVFGTETTISESTYLKRLTAAGWSPSHIDQVACPGLQTSISNQDRVEEKVAAFTRDADKNSWYLMACTHFGIRADAFKHHKILDPNRAMAQAACDRITATGAVSLHMVSRYPINPNELKTWAALLGEPSTVAMLLEHRVEADLF